jgi:hypothetical protein
MLFGICNAVDGRWIGLHVAVNAEETSIIHSPLGHSTPYLFHHFGDIRQTAAATMPMSASVRHKLFDVRREYKTLIQTRRDRPEVLDSAQS